MTRVSKLDWADLVFRWNFFTARVGRNKTSSVVEKL